VAPRDLGSIANLHRVIQATNTGRMARSRVPHSHRTGVCAPTARRRRGWVTRSGGSSGTAGSSVRPRAIPQLAHSRVRRDSPPICSASRRPEKLRGRVVTLGDQTGDLFSMLATPDPGTRTTGSFPVVAGDKVAASPPTDERSAQRRVQEKGAVTLRRLLRDPGISRARRLPRRRVCYATGVRPSCNRRQRRHGANWDLRTTRWAVAALRVDGALTAPLLAEGDAPIAADDTVHMGFA
jgi:hypothetical protein